MKFINKFYLMLISVIIIIIPYSVQGESYIPYKDPGKYINISKQPVPLNIKFPK